MLRAEALAEGPPKSLVVIDQEYCKGCNICVVTCPQGNLKLTSSLNKGGYHPVEFSYRGERGECTGCGICYWVCPDFAIAEIMNVKVVK
jgi:2-oxoglutarate ferredoxin oxidoreductase subunit delta